MEKFLDHVKASSERGRKILEEEWIEECAILATNMRNDIETWMPEDEVSVDKTKPIYLALGAGWRRGKVVRGFSVD